jgi:diadenylate cyclase
VTDWFNRLERYTFLFPGLTDLLQILIVAAGLYYVLRLLVRTRAIQMLLGLVLLVVVYFLARLLDLNLISYLMGKLFQYGAIAALIAFQPELRSALARLGQNRMLRFFRHLEQGAVVEELVEAVERLSRAKIGAIIALEREVGLEEYSAEQGTRINAPVSAELLLSLFSPYGPLHDGAVLIAGDTILAAGVILPLTQFPVADRSLGTRHRAALGLSEETDALVIVVSEETAQVSIAHRGRLERGIPMERFREVLAGSAVVSATPARE